MIRQNCTDTITESVTMSLTWRDWLKDGKRLVAADVMRTWSLIKVWDKRARQRHELKGLSDHTLNDIGVSRAEIDREAHKPFWKD